jgi:ABC-2 type transport system permease protein
VKEIIRAAYVIGRRDFHAIIFSKAFIFFLIGPLFPLLVGGLAGSLGGAVAKDIDRPVLGIALRADEAEKLTTARMFLTKELGEDSFPEFRTLPSPAAGVKLDAKALLADKKAGLAGILGGTLQNPELTGTAGQVGRWKGKIALLAGHALSGQAINLPAVKTDIVNKSAGGAKQQRVLTAQLAQVLLFMLTMLLAGMVLSNLVEEKSNKIIEILAASIPMESVFLGKLFAMLAMAFIGIIVWTSVGMLLLGAAGPGLPSLPTPAVGWPIFLTLGVVYFAMAYLMFGSLFLGIGAQAGTVREVQTLSMPATMGQMLVFFFTSYTVGKMGQPIEQFAAFFPFSSPYAMIARAAQDDRVWIHGVAILGQLAFATLLLRVSVKLFKRNVMKSGSAGRIKDGGRRRLFGLIPIGRA